MVPGASHSSNYSSSGPKNSSNAGSSSPNKNAATSFPCTVQLLIRWHVDAGYETSSTSAVPNTKNGRDLLNNDNFQVRQFLGRRAHFGSWVTSCRCVSSGPSGSSASGSRSRSLSVMWVMLVKWVKWVFRKSRSSRSCVYQVGLGQASHGGSSQHQTRPGFAQKRPVCSTISRSACAFWSTV